MPPQSIVGSDKRKFNQVTLDTKDNPQLDPSTHFPDPALRFKQLEAEAWLDLLRLVYGTEPFDCLEDLMLLSLTELVEAALERLLELKPHGA